MKSEKLEIVNKLGLHARAASKFASTAAKFSAKITVAKDGKDVDGKSIISLMLLAAAQGSHLHLTCEGDDENEAFTALADLIANRFDEEE